MPGKILLPEVEKLLSQKDYKTIKSMFKEMLPYDIAELLHNVRDKNVILLFRLIPSDKVSDVFSELDPSLQKYILSNFADKEIKHLILELEPDDRTSLFEELPGRLTQKILNFLPEQERRDALKLLGYPEDSVGRLMTPDYVAVRPHWTVAKCFDHIRKYGYDAETIDIIYVVDDNWKLMDDIPIRRFILAESNQRVEDIMDYSFICISAYEDQEKAYELVKKYNLTVLPVVDRDGVLLGIVTIDDLIDIQEKEVDEDFQKTSAILPIEGTYLFSSPLTLYKKRAGWLLILLVADFLSSSVIAHFQSAIKAVIALAFFIPVLIDSGGNIASQSSTLVIRALATGELTIKDWFDVVKKELFTGMMIGITLGLILYIRGFFWRGGPVIGMVVGISMVGISVWSNLLGSLLPIILTKFNMDPAVISSPLLTTVIDSTGLIIYFTVAKFVFHLS